MTTDLYIRLVIRKHMVKKQVRCFALSAAKQLYPWIRIWGRILGGVNQAGIPLMPRDYIIKINQVGSFAKETNIIGGTDLDLFISLSHKTPGTLESIYNSFVTYLELIGFETRRQNVSIGIKYRNLSFDLVPGKRQSGITNDHSIYKRKAGTWTKTNVYKHISHVKKSGRRREILAMKIWRTLHGLEFPSFYLELSVMEALRGRLLGRLSRNLERVFEYLAFDFQEAKILDPANYNNVVSDDLTEGEKQTITNAASQSQLKILKGSWKEIIW